MKQKKGVIEGALASFVLAEEQVLLAKQRTMLSSMRTGLAFIGVGIVVIKFWSDILSWVIAALLIFIGFAEIYRAKEKLGEYNERLRSLRKAIRNRDTETLKKEWFE
ncbi:MAG: DUF202 domain-containing protein [Candidatus Aenigmarchaeota archaeon]|nr:DUF202 domain-containing protein [Candidatus Aenigmarchaeota archaeon]